MHACIRFYMILCNEMVVAYLWGVANQISICILSEPISFLCVAISPK